MIIVAGLSADYEMECRTFDNISAGLNRAEIERVVGNQYTILLRQQQDSKTLPVSKGTTTADRGKENNTRLRNKFEGNCFICGKKSHRAEECRSAKKSENSGDAAADRKGGGKGKCYVYGSEDHLAHKNYGLCKSLEHRTRECEEREAEKGTMLAKLNVPAISEVGPMAEMMGAARVGSEEECESDSGPAFHMPHTRAGMTAYKKASPRTTAQVADGNILPVYGFWRLEVNPGPTW